MRLSSQPLVALVLAAGLLAASSSAQVGGFTDGDMYLYSRAVNGNGSQDGGILRIDPLSGQTEQIVDFSFASYGKGTMVFDSYRKRLVFSTAIDVGGPQYGLWTCDATGALELLAPTNGSTHGLAATDDGRIYVITPQDGSAPFKYYDAANRKQTLLDATGTTGFGFSGIFSMNDSCMTYDAGSNALFVAYRGSSGPGCNGASAYGTTIRKLPLSSDGSRVVGPVECLEFQADPTQSTEVPSNWSRGPGGMLVLVCDTPGNGQDLKPRVVRIDPHAFGASTWAEPGGFPGADQLTAGAYSSVRNDVLVLDTLNNVLRGYAAGASGAGELLAPVGLLSPELGAGEYATLVEIDNSACGGAFQAYGVGLAGGGGFVPALWGSGCAEVGGSITLNIRETLGGASGHLFLGVAEGAIPFKGGTFHLAAASLLVPLVMGSPSGVGTGQADLVLPLPSDPGFSGFTLFLQAGFVDPAAPVGVSLTQGLRMLVD